MDEARRAHQNFADFIRWYKVLDPATVELDEDGVLAVAYGPDWPSTRQALRVDDALGPDEWVARAHGFLMDHGSMACIFVREGPDDPVAERLLGLGYRTYERTPELVCRAPVPARPPAPDQVVRLVATPAEALAFADVAATAFTALGIPDGPSRDLLAKPELLLDPQVIVALGWLDGAPVAGALCLLVGDHPHGYVGWVSCLEAARGRGLGDAVTRLVTNEAFARGAGLVSLEASRFGEAIYRRMGYDELYWYQLLIKA